MGALPGVRSALPAPKEAGGVGPCVSAVPSALGRESRLGRGRLLLPVLLPALQHRRGCGVHVQHEALPAGHLAVPQKVPVSLFWDMDGCSVLRSLQEAGRAWGRGRDGAVWDGGPGRSLSALPPGARAPAPAAGVAVRPVLSARSPGQWGGTSGRCPRAQGFCSGGDGRQRDSVRASWGVPSCPFRLGWSHSLCTVGGVGPGAEGTVS